MELLTNLTLIACLCSALAVTCATIVIVDFITEASNRYKERYIEETSVQYDDILLQMPPEKIFYLRQRGHLRLRLDIKELVDPVRFPQKFLAHFVRNSDDFIKHAHCRSPFCIFCDGKV